MNSSIARHFDRMLAELDASGVSVEERLARVAVECALAGSAYHLALIIRALDNYHPTLAGCDDEEDDFDQ
jgi:hypothetical protein